MQIFSNSIVMREYNTYRGEAGNIGHREEMINYPAFNNRVEPEREIEVPFNYAELKSKSLPEVRALVRRMGFYKVRTASPGRRLYAHVVNSKTWIPIELNKEKDVAEKVMKYAYGLPPKPSKIPEQFNVHKTKKGYFIITEKYEKKARPVYYGPHKESPKEKFKRVVRRVIRYPRKPKHEETYKESPKERFKRIVRRVIRQPYKEREKHIIDLIRENKERRAELKKAYRNKHPLRKTDPFTRIATRTTYLGTHKGGNGVYRETRAPEVNKERLSRAVAKYTLGSVHHGALRRQLQVIEVRPEIWTSKLFVSGKTPESYTIPELKKLLKKYEPDVKISHYDTKGKLTDRLYELYSSLRPDENKPKAPRSQRREISNEELNRRELAELNLAEEIAEENYRMKKYIDSLK